MNIHMTIKLNKERDISPIPSALYLNVDGTDYLFTWDETNATRSGDDSKIIDYWLKGASIENDNLSERYPNGLLNENSVCRLNEICWDEDGEEEFDESILNLELRDDYLSVSCKLDNSTPRVATPEIHRMLTLSTGHITKETSILLDNDKMEVVAYRKDDYGWFVTCWNLDGTLPDDLRACAEYAEKNECDWLCLDCDGSVVDDLPAYHW